MNQCKKNLKEGSQLISDSYLELVRHIKYMHHIYIMPFISHALHEVLMCGIEGFRETCNLSYYILHGF
jgi:hypothetical protein